ncbi:ribosome maturation factor RimP [Exilibacterium tricleocarpae]|uniref:Ribosome maturation factor RimP n=1 Tax=Exilibacterium tricleocarpae TaxID=2591008 RepID=A0A545SZW3_9GAMM|nr:ribosome maturation factor RimP [Exilibacterium tricleocarpae]TQV70507.1 ribosome maturation factor RimP [Exilibacterium tricleocarpae]
MASKQEELKALLAPTVAALECELWGLEYFSQGKHTTLRLYIDAEGGVTLQDCERVSRQVSSVLDVEDPIHGEYALEVSSPGVDRPLYTLEHFARYAGEQVTVKLRVPFDGRRKFSGTLRGVEGDEVVVVVDDHEYLLPLDSIDRANIIPRL